MLDPSECLLLRSATQPSDIEAAASRILLHTDAGIVTRLQTAGPRAEETDQSAERELPLQVGDHDFVYVGEKPHVTGDRRVAPLGGPPVEPNLEEAYLAEIERVDAGEGRERKEEIFSFLDRGAA